MKFLADENFPRPAVLSIRDHGFDIHWISEQHPGATDEEVLLQSVADSHPLLTLEKDFGELAFRRGLATGCGIILFRLEPQSPGEITAVALATLRSRNDWTGYFAVASRGRLRLTPIRGPSKHP